MGLVIESNKLSSLVSDLNPIRLLSKELVVPRVRINLDTITNLDNNQDTIGSLGCCIIRCYYQLPLLLLRTLRC